MFRKIVLYDFEEDSLDENFLDKLRDIAENLEVVYTEADYTGKLSEEHLSGADALITRVFDDYSKELFEGSDIDYIGMMATDASHFPVETLEEHDITLTYVPKYATESVAELTVSMLLNISLRTIESLEFVEGGNWDIGPFPGNELKGKEIGIIGLGRIGSRVAELASGFDMNVSYHSRSRKDWAREEGYDYKELEELLKSSDVISIHCSLNDKTERMLDESKLSLLDKGTIVLNAAREEIQDIDKTIELCDEDKIKVWIDALEDPEDRREILDTGNAYLTSHSGCATEEAQERLKKMVLENIKSYQGSETQNVFEP